MIFAFVLFISLIYVLMFTVLGWVFYELYLWNKERKKDVL